MSDVAIKVRDLGKLYKIGQGKKPYKTLGETFSEKFKKTGLAGKTTDFWALQNVDFEIKRGEVVGVIGKNGAGKSTLLKILSRITEPTRGQVDLYGRVGSLLEVGTGFHPELTGRENIYLSGAILGMKRLEIKKKMDEIVAFSEIEKFVDTPVKHYSSGMYVRLAFSVAAHLESEIMLVDEVLAVGDMEFQSKCIAKMKEVVRQGQTILFVSHNLSAIKALCSRGIVFDNGELKHDSPVQEAVEYYLGSNNHSLPSAEITWPETGPHASKDFRFIKASLSGPEEIADSFDCQDSFFVNVEYEVLKPIQGLRIGMMMQTLEEIVLFGSATRPVVSQEICKPGIYRTQCRIPGYLLNEGKYSLCFGADNEPFAKFKVLTPYCLSVTIQDFKGRGFSSRQPGLLKPDIQWKSESLQ